MDRLFTLGAPIARALLGLWFSVRIEGIDHVPRTGRAVLAGNHLSVLDGPVLAIVTAFHRRRETRFLIAAEVFDGPFGWFLRLARQIPIRRGQGDAGALDEAGARLRDGACIGIFPEGRVGESPDGELQRIRAGLTRIAIPAAAPIVPVGMWGTQAAWPRSGLRIRALLTRTTLAVVYGSPLYPSPDESPEAFRERFADSLCMQVARARRLSGDAR